MRRVGEAAQFTWFHLEPSFHVRASLDITGMSCREGAGTYPSCMWAEDGVHPGQVSTSMQGQHRYTAPNILIACISSRDFFLLKLEKMFRTKGGIAGPKKGPCRIHKIRLAGRWSQSQLTSGERQGPLWTVTSPSQDTQTGEHIETRPDVICCLIKYLGEPTTE
ncbi:uncharacterized protein LOC133542020 isoform X2 [Nerophis ophidion]|uniref:uncharacterized protein LOC133542020 isoform X2 n=1 Tax=Nerophis ophidion TaxID=159077 RepID=UPI002AE01BC2|nr:uncharacterized protein LOC133542020 isoform X2 [Nerophis ophidion]